MQLLQLPDHCLVAVLQHCAHDYVSLFSAARSHSRLHQAAGLVLTSITADIRQVEQSDGLLLYLARHGQHTHSVTAKVQYGFGGITLAELSPNVQLSSLELTNFNLQLQPSNGYLGMMQPGLPLKQLRLTECKLLDGEEGLAAALSLLPELQHLSIRIIHWDLNVLTFPTSALLGLQQLTYLELACIYVHGPDTKGPALQPLQALTRLADLRLAPVIEPGSLVAVDSSMLSGMQHLAQLKIGSRVELDPGALAGKTRLQHLKLSCSIADAAAAGLTQLLSELQQLQQLTHLVLTREVFQEGDQLRPSCSYNFSPDSKQQTAATHPPRLPIGISCLAAHVSCWQAATTPAVVRYFQAPPQ
jgi:hypothetical protein